MIRPPHTRQFSHRNLAQSQMVSQHEQDAVSFHYYTRSPPQNIFEHATHSPSHRPSEAVDFSSVHARGNREGRCGANSALAGRDALRYSPMRRVRSVSRIGGLPCLSSKAKQRKIRSRCSWRRQPDEKNEENGGPGVSKKPGRLDMTCCR